MEALGQFAAQSLELSQARWSARQVTEVLQPFAVLHMRHQQLMLAAEGHFRTCRGAYSPRDVVRLLGGFRDTGHLGVYQVAQFWGATRSRLRLFTGLQTLEVAGVLVRFRHGLPAGELRKRFALLARSLRKSVHILPARSLCEIVAVWAAAGIRDYTFLSSVASAALDRLEDLANDLSPDEISRTVYAFVKLGAPTQVPQDFAPTIEQLLLRAIQVCDDTAVLSSLDSRGLRRLALSLVLWGPPAVQCGEVDWKTLRADACDNSIPRDLLARRTLLGRCLAALLPRADAVGGSGGLTAALAIAAAGRAGSSGLSHADASGRDSSRADNEALDQVRLIAVSAREEFAIEPNELSPAAAARYEKLLTPPVFVAPKFVTRGGQAAGTGALRPYERDVYFALQRLLGEWNKAGFASVPTAEAAVLQPVAQFEVSLAVPAWKAVVEVGCPEDFFEGAFVGGGVAANPEKDAVWQRLPLLRTRLLRCLGWHVVEVPFFTWQGLGSGTEQRQFLRGRLREAARKAAASVPISDEDET